MEELILTVVSGSGCDAIHLAQVLICHERQRVCRDHTDQYVCRVVSIRGLVVAFIGRHQCRYRIELKLDVK